MSALFLPTLEAVHARLDAVDPAAYARSRNHIDGAVTRLSPYLTHGLLTLPEAYRAIHARTPLEPQGKLVFEFGWRAYHHQVWAHLGERIHRDLHPGLLDASAYAAELPEDVRQAATGIPAIDLAVRELYETGYVHNHARMWLASYLVHLRKVHWHAGARWMLGHLLDGDLASNHLSWQWVAGTGSSKPYLFNADNVAKYAPAQWHSPGTIIDTSYEALDHIARSAAPTRPPNPHNLPGMQQPELFALPPDGAWSAPDSRLIADRDVWLVHPWSMRGAPHTPQRATVVIGVGFAETHALMPWSAKRWRFITQGLQAQTTSLWWGPTAQLFEALRTARRVAWQPDLHVPAGPTGTQDHSPDLLFEPVDSYCSSFTQWWRRTRLTQ